MNANRLEGECRRDRAAFESEGISLWKQLQKELAANYEVVY